MSDQRTQQWFADRIGKLTASRFPDMMATVKGGKPAASRDKLIAQLAVERIACEPTETYQNAAMQRGIDLEPLARAVYEDRYCVLVEEVGFMVHPQFPFAGASPDGLVGDDGMVEFKCPDSMARHADNLLRGAAKNDYWWQVQGQMWVTGRKWVDLMSYDPRFPPGLQVAVMRCFRDEDDIAKLEKACIEVNDLIDAMVVQLLMIKE